MLSNESCAISNYDWSPDGLSVRCLGLEEELRACEDGWARLRLKHKGGLVTRGSFERVDGQPFFPEIRFVPFELNAEPLPATTEAR